MKTHRVILRCNSDDDLYTFLGNIPTRRPSFTALIATNSVLFFLFFLFDSTGTGRVSDAEIRGRTYTMRFFFSYFLTVNGTLLIT
jgi:hypothetical protein